MTIPTLHRPIVRQLFFWTGIVSTLMYRCIVLLNGYSKTWVSVTWYIGTVGFIIYFAHRFQISRRRAAIIHGLALDQKVVQNSSLTVEEKAGLAYVFSTLESSKEKWNYVVIFASSAVALVLGLYLDFLR